MASIKGWQAKNIKHFRGRDWGGVECDLYLDGKKVGFYYDDGNGGEADIDFVSKELEEKVKADAKTYYAEHPLTGICADLPPTYDLFLGEVLALHDIEKEYKKMSKMGFPFMLVFKQSEDDFDEQVKGFNLEAARKRFLEKNTVFDARTFDRLEDFIIN